MGSGRDGTGLGRWTWMQYRGWNGLILQAICAYRPCMPSGMNKVFSVYAQHGRYFDMLKDDVCPWHAFVRDIGKELDAWLEMGNHIVIALDANEDMRQGPVSDAFRKRGL